MVTDPTLRSFAPRLLLASLLFSCGCSNSAPATGAMTDAPSTADIIEVAADGAAPLDVPDALVAADGVDAPTDGEPDVSAADVRDALPGGCSSDTDCAGAPDGALTCDPATSRCVQCLPSDDRCPPAQHCDGMGFRCVPGCRSDEGCPAPDGGAPARCDTMNHACVECARDDQCPTGRVCLRSACVPGCNDARPCSPGETCCAGACARLSDDQANCGACGTTCRTPNGTPACMDATCVAGTCGEGFADCNRSNADGCETALSSDLANCGACGNACPTPANAEGARCLAGRCEFACREGFADCDADARDGCESRLATDARHCGACGNACPNPANARATCAGGACGFACDAGFGDCDGDASNGCETDLGTNVGSCGRCGSACTAPGGTPACSAGSCSIASCGGAFADCDMSVTNGCETDLATTAAHCGACGRACDPPNATGACRMGACAVAACDAGFADCDGDPGNGCEVDLRSTVSACGACGRRCFVPYATAGCSMGACTVAACNAGFADCDGIATNGCEAHLLASLDSCGACGARCTLPNAWSMCTNGACELVSCAAFHRDCDGNAANGCEANIETDPSNCHGCGMRGTEYCNGVDDDCDTLVDERCPTGVTGLTTLSSQSPTWGGGGGTPYDLTCPPGQVVRGIFGRSGGYLDSLGIICGAPRLDPFTLRIVLDTGPDVGPVGGGGGAPFRDECPLNSMVVRVQGSAGGYIDGIIVTCVALEAVGDTTSGYRIGVRGVFVGSRYGGFGGDSFDYFCPANAVLRRFFGGAGGYVDRLTANCDTLALTTR